MLFRSLAARGHAPEHTQEIHYGYLCEVGPNGELIADIPAELLEVELSAGRVQLVPEEPVE